MTTLRLSGVTRKKLLKRLRGKPREESDIDELLGILLQVSLALMLIFMIAFLMFMSKVGGEIRSLDQLKQEVAENRRARLLHALEAEAENARIRYGLRIFEIIDPATGKRSFRLGNLVGKGRILRETPEAQSFLAGGHAAYEDFIVQKDALPSRVKEAVLKRSGFPETELTSDEIRFLEEAVQNQLTRLRGEVFTVQQLAAAAFQRHLAERVDQLNAPEIRVLARKINAATDSAERVALLRELQKSLEQYVWNELAKSGDLPLLTATAPQEKGNATP